MLIAVSILSLSGSENSLQITKLTKQIGGAYLDKLELSLNVINTPAILL